MNFLNQVLSSACVKRFTSEGLILLSFIKECENWIKCSTSSGVNGYDDFAPATLKIDGNACSVNASVIRFLFSRVLPAWLLPAG